MTAAPSPIAYFDGRWVPDTELALSLEDLGVVQGVTVVERLRTWNGALPTLAAHLARLRHSADALRIPLPPREQVANLVLELLSRNAPAGESAHPSQAEPSVPPDAPDGASDWGILILATPGQRGQSTPTLCMRVLALDLERLHRLRTHGQPLVITSVRQPDPGSWPRTIKVRCRIHYYLADASAREQAPDALGVLLDQDGSVTETSTANILVAHDDRLVLPPEGRVLEGVMQSTLCALAQRQGVRIERRPIPPDELRSARHVWLSGAEGGLWPANAVDGEPKTIDGLVTRWQQRLWDCLTRQAGH